MANVFQQIPPLQQLPVPQRGPQPDWNCISQKLGRAANLPAYQDSQHLHNAILLANNNIRIAHDENVRQHGLLIQSLMWMEENFTSKVQNAWATNPDTPLYPLIDLTTGQYFVGFPTDKRMIDNWTGLACDAFLATMHVPPNQIPRNDYDKKRLIKAKIGAH